jgi:hypothetical protein
MRRNFLFRLRKPAKPTIETLSTMPMKPSCLLSTNVHLRFWVALATHPLISNDRRPTQSLRFTARHLRWLPLVVSDAQKAQRVTLSRQLLRTLEVQRDQASRDIITLDESRFSPTTDHEFIWPRQGEKVSGWSHYTLQSKNSC